MYQIRRASVVSSALGGGARELAQPEVVDVGGGTGRSASGDGEGRRDDDEETARGVLVSR